MGGKCKKERNWKKINEKYVKEGMLIFDKKALKGWVKKRKPLNRKKVGAPFVYPKEFVMYAGVLQALFHLHYRQTQGLISQLGKLVRIPSIPDYSTLFRRINKLEWKIEDNLVNSKEPCVIALDASGIKVNNYFEWMRHKWRKRRGFVKIHVAVDTKTKEVLSLEVTDEKVVDHHKFKKLVRNSKKIRDIKQAQADGAYDVNECFEYLDKHKIEPAIRLRGNACIRSSSSWLRKKEIRLRNQLGGQEAWRDKKGYGKRWSSEGVFSSFKRRFGEYVNCRLFGNMVNEIKRKFWVYNLLINMC